MFISCTCGDGVFLEEIQKGNYEYNSGFKRHCMLQRKCLPSFALSYKWSTFVSLHVHERIDPKTIIESVKKEHDDGGQMSMFSLKSN